MVERIMDFWKFSADTPKVSKLGESLAKFSATRFVLEMRGNAHFISTFYFMRIARDTDLPLGTLKIWSFSLQWLEII